MAKGGNIDWGSEENFKLSLRNYMERRGMHNTAAIFQEETDVPEDPVASEAIHKFKRGFMKEWWETFMATHPFIREKFKEKLKEKYPKGKGKAPVQPPVFSRQLNLNNSNVKYRSVPQRFALHQQRPRESPVVTRNGNAMLRLQATRTLPESRFHSQQQILPPLGNIATLPSITTNSEVIDVDYPDDLSMPGSSRSSSSYRQRQFSGQNQQIVARDNRSRGGIPSTHPGPSGSTLRPPASSRPTNITHQPVVRERTVNLIARSFARSAVSLSEDLRRRINAAAQQSQQNMLSQSLPQASGNQLTNLPATSFNRNLMLSDTNLRPSGTKRQIFNSGYGNNTLDSANVENYEGWNEYTELGNITLDAANVEELERLYKEFRDEL